MTAEQTEVVGQDVAVKRLTELRAERTATNPTGQAAEDGHPIRNPRVMPTGPANAPIAAPA